MSGRLPTGLLVEAVLRNLTKAAVPYYILQTGNHGSGLLMLKLSDTKGQCRLITQQRNFETDELEWVDALNQDMVEEQKADAYIQRAKDFDPDIWIIEIEDTTMKNPFEEE